MACPHPLWLLDGELSALDAVDAVLCTLVLFWDEVFVHLNATRRTASGLDQHRVFGGLGVALAPATRVEVGYLNHYINSFSGSDRSHHVLSVVLNATF